MVKRKISTLLFVSLLHRKSSVPAKETQTEKKSTTVKLLLHLNSAYGCKVGILFTKNQIKPSSIHVIEIIIISYINLKVPSKSRTVLINWKFLLGLTRKIDLIFYCENTFSSFYLELKSLLHKMFRGRKSFKVGLSLSKKVSFYLH